MLSVHEPALSTAGKVTLAEIRDVSFHEELGGYDPTGVDDLLDRLEGAVLFGVAYERLVRKVRLGWSLRGYRRSEVDAFLARFRDPLSQLGDAPS